MSLKNHQVRWIDDSFAARQLPVGGILQALQQGKVGPVSTKSLAEGFDAAALNALIAAVATTTAQQTTSATVGTATTVTVDNVAVKPVWWHPVNASGDTPPNIQSMSYSGTTATFTVASSIASQTFQIQFI